MTTNTLYSEAYRIAERVHQGMDEDTLREECGEAAALLNDPDINWERVYCFSELLYAREFESR